MNINRIINFFKPIIGILPQINGGWGEDSTSRWDPTIKRLTANIIKTPYIYSDLGILIESWGNYEFTCIGNINFFSDSGETIFDAPQGITFYGTRMYVTGKAGIGVASPTAALHIKAGSAAANTAPIKLTSGAVMTTPQAGAIEFLTDNFFVTITTGAARKALILDNGARLTSGKYPKASTNGRLIDGPTPLAGTKVYYVSDTSGGAVTRKLTFTDGILTAEV